MFHVALQKFVDWHAGPKLGGKLRPGHFTNNKASAKLPFTEKEFNNLLIQNLFLIFSHDSNLTVTPVGN